jgi:drug/metabolite transporter (DMT)-like permease
MSETRGDTFVMLAYLAMGIVITSNVLGSVFIKIGSSVPTERALLFGLFGWQTIAGIMCFAFAMLFYALALKELPLHVAQAIATLQYVGSVAAAVLIFGEIVTMEKWFGIALICIGVIFVSR